MTLVEFLKENHGVINMALCIVIIILLVWILTLEIAEHSNSFASTQTKYKEGMTKKKEREKGAFCTIL